MQSSQAQTASDGPSGATLIEENARLRGDLLTIASRISHDLRTPLGCIYTTSDALRETLGGAGSEQAVLPRAIIESADEMIRLLERVSFVLRASAKPLGKEVQPMGDSVLRAWQRLERRIDERHATLIRPEIWPAVFGVASWIEVIWWNLVSNALIHGGTEPQVEMGFAELDDGQQFWVSDRGPGVPVDARGRLFSPFESLHDRRGGRGLGLPIVRRLVELQGGRCGYEENPGGGARFRFWLPKAPGAQG